MTPFGWIYFATLAAVLLGARRWLGAFALGTSVFQAAAIANLPLGEQHFGIPPYAVAAAACGGVLVLRLWRQRAWPTPWAEPRALRLLLGFAYLAIAGALVLPRVFEGTPVHPLLSRWGFDLAPIGLDFGPSNIAQAGNLALHLLVLAYVADDARDPTQRTRLLIGVLAAAAGVLAILAWERLAGPGGLPTLQRFWLSNTGYNSVFTEIYQSGIRREFAPFSEPSYAGAYLAGPLVGAMAVATFGQRAVHALAGCVALGLAVVGTMSGAGIAAVVLSALCLLALLTVDAAKTRAASTAPRRARIAWAACAMLALASLVAIRFAPSSQFVVAADSVLFSKSESESAARRTRSNQHALAVLRATHGLGAGLGSNRASSWFASLASNTGLPGLLLWFGVLAVLAKRYLRHQLTDSQLFAAGLLFGTTIAVGLAIPDLNIAYYWAALMLALVLAPRPGEAAVAAA